MSINRLLGYEYRIRVADTGFLIEFPDLPSCSSTGLSIEEVKENGLKAIRAYEEWKHI